jgi:integrase/recombinase XerC
MTELMTIASAAAVTARPTMEAIAARWTAFLEVKPQTAKVYTKAVRLFIAYLNAHGVTDPQREDVIAYRQSLTDAGRAAGTIQIYLIAVKLFFRWAASEKLYDNIADNIKTPKVGREHKKDYFQGGQIADILGKVNTTKLTGKRDYAMIVIAATTGLRTISLRRANVEDVEYRGGAAVLYHQGKGRDEKREYVKLIPEAESAIRDYLNARGPVKEDEPLFAAPYQNARRAGTPEGSAGRMATESISRIIKTAFRKAGFDNKRWTAHSLRHTAATLALKADAPIRDVMKMMGHQNVATTEIYLHDLSMENNNVSELVGKAIFGRAA